MRKMTIKETLAKYEFCDELLEFMRNRELSSGAIIEVLGLQAAYLGIAKGLNYRKIVERGFTEAENYHKQIKQAHENEDYHEFATR